ncbi:23S rRNA (guanosine(2251)-2'-O)-methyltransferase RlmB [Natranaerofaba carboxydovora]|uniref:23S rRNA (guanosine(2251)-2'-O)-methyltransferase RlmB n=1 Tax=Natranaerofaba carboxydovora TaxID=2742683 RepID=UPI001F135795|nr:23S rRNA (guanosine(2251)-2'-O)-methyltransferase RlmB [Natranaerofaba carboxydovora]UMZ75375.1 Putative TrmH family tRNA/rRNA methyltransferase [Natranaerofaba carboxydovora]
MSQTIIYGKNPVVEAIKAGRKIHKIEIVGTEKGKFFEEVSGLAKENKIPLETIDKKTLVKKVDTNEHQGVVAFVEPYNFVSVNEILEYAKGKSEQPLIIILDHVKDPQNLGGIIRTAEAVGAHGIIIPKDRAAGITPAVFKASSGALEHVKVAKVSNISRTINELQKKWIWVIGCESEGAENYFDVKYDTPLTMVLGSEGEGLSNLVKKNCDFLVKIPMYGNVNSLNVSTAGSIILYEIVKQRM